MKPDSIPFYSHGKMLTMTNYKFPVGPESAFLFGCGRFRMEEHLLENCAAEIIRFGRHPLFVCDDNSHGVAFEKVAATREKPRGSHLLAR